MGTGFSVSLSHTAIKTRFGRLGLKKFVERVGDLIIVLSDPELGIYRKQISSDLVTGR